MSGGIYRSEKLNYYKVIIPKESAWLTVDGFIIFIIELFVLRNWEIIPCPF